MGTWNKKSWLIYIASTTLIPNSREKPGSHFILRKIENNSRLIISWSHLNWPSPGQIGNSTSRWRKKMEEWNPLLSLEETEDGETTKETSITWCTKTEDLTRFPLSQMRIVPFFLGGGGMEWERGWQWEYCTCTVKRTKKYDILRYFHPIKFISWTRKLGWSSCDLFIIFLSRYSEITCVVSVYGA